MPRLFQIGLCAVLLGTMATGCSDSVPSASDGKRSSLAQALAFAPENAGEVYVTDWDQIERDLGMEGVDAKAPDEQIRDFLRRLQTEHSPLSQAPLQDFITNPMDGAYPSGWAWSLFDELWEATVLYRIPRSPGTVTLNDTFEPAHVFRMRDDFDFGPLLSQFAERKYREVDYRGVAIYSRELGLDNPWGRTATGLSMGNAAVLLDEKLLIVSRGAGRVEALLDAYSDRERSLHDSEDVAAVAQQLGVARAAVVRVQRGGNCLLSVGADTMAPDMQKELHKELGNPPKVHNYDVLGLGYRYENKELVAQVVMHYPEASTAEADLEIRRNAIETGSSLTWGKDILYREALFDIETASVEGKSLLMKVLPREIDAPQSGAETRTEAAKIRSPQFLFKAYLYRDMAFAACP